jgi:phosphosulfolactate synthase
MTETERAIDLVLPFRQRRPREHGLTIMIDSGLPLGYFTDLIESNGDFVDFVKFGWGTALVTKELNRKIDVLRAAGIEFFFGGTLFEKFVLQRRVDEFRRLCASYDCHFVEVSNGTIDLGDRDKSDYVALMTEDFQVISEVGSKDQALSETMAPFQWIACLKDDLDAGASLVTLETRESGRGGICRPNGELRYGLIEEILSSGVDSKKLVFEAPTTDLQNHFVRRIGTHVNLANIAATDLIGLETIRLGLRSETLLTFETAAEPPEGAS